MYINNKIYFQLFSKDTATAFFAKLCYNWKQRLGAGASAGRRPSDGRRIARVARAIYPGGKHSSGGHVLADKPAFGVACRTGKFCRPAIRVPRAEPKASASPCLCPWQTRRARYVRAFALRQTGQQHRVQSWQLPQSYQSGIACRQAQTMRVCAC